MFAVHESIQYCVALMGLSGQVKCLDGGIAGHPCWQLVLAWEREIYANESRRISCCGVFDANDH